MTTIKINSQTMYIKHIDAFSALLVDEDEKEHKVPAWALKEVFPVGKVSTKKKQSIKNKK